MGKRLLFVNACTREKSRTLRLCRAFLEELPDTWEVTEIELSREALRPLSREDIALRDAALASGDFSDEYFRYARGFAEADHVLIGAPYWDLSFPASLKLYLENVSVTGLIFRYGENGAPVPLGRARDMTYVVSSGGYIGEFDSGERYLRDICRLFGITDFHSFSAQGLDIHGNDVEAIMSDAMDRLREFGRSCK